MSHALHRVGTKENLENDYTIVVRPERGYNKEGSGLKLKKALQIMSDNNAVNICGARGDKYQGTSLKASLESIIESINDTHSIYGAFNSKEDIIGFMREMIKADLGLSVVIQGLYDNVADCCHEVGLKPHTTNHSLGVWGNRERLPDKRILEITTMCGHSVVASSLVAEQIRLIKEGKVSLSEAALTIAEPCVCGIVNPKRAEQLLKDLVESE